jgi:hypothetical protein
MNFHSTDESCRFRSFPEVGKYCAQSFELLCPDAQEEESRRILRTEQDQAWGNRLVGPQTPLDYLEKEEAAWQRHLDRVALIETGKGAKWSLCRMCGKEKISARRSFCARCRLLRKRRRNRKLSDTVKRALVSLS